MKLKPWLRGDCVNLLQWQKQHLKAGLMAQMAQKTASTIESQNKQPGMTFLIASLRLRAHWHYTSRTDYPGVTDGYTSQPVHAAVVCKQWRLRLCPNAPVCLLLCALYDVKPFRAPSW